MNVAKEEALTASSIRANAFCNVAKLGIVGECLAALGIHDGGAVLVDLLRQPLPDEICVCTDPKGNVQCKQYVGPTADGQPFVRTRYADFSQSRVGGDYGFIAGEILGTVVAVFDAKGDLKMDLQIPPQQPTTLNVCGHTAPVVDRVAFAHGEFAGQSVPVVQMSLK